MILSSLIVSVNTLSAQEPPVTGNLIQYQPLEPLPGAEDSETVSDLPTYLANMFKLAIGLAALFAVVMITIGGIEYMMSESLGGKADGKERITNAIIGLLLAVSAWLILYTVNPKTIEFNFNPDPIETIIPPTTNIPGYSTTPTSTPTNQTPAQGNTSSTPAQGGLRYWYKLDICHNNNNTQIQTLASYSYHSGNQEEARQANLACTNAQPRGQSYPVVTPTCNQGHNVICHYNQSLPTP